jgi:hypothetical protein
LYIKKSLEKKHQEVSKNYQLAPQPRDATGTWYISWKPTSAEKTMERMGIQWVYGSEKS